MTDHRFAFIAGLHRSGTSLLFQCLREHPQLSGFRDTGAPEDEGQHLQSVYRRASRLGGPGRFGFSAKSHLTEASNLVSDENRLKLFAQWQPHWDLTKSWLLEKTPQNLLQTRFLQAMFPEARFIVMQRHPVAVSYATRRWSRTSLHSLVDHWLRCHEIFEADRAHLNHALVIQYEDFVAAPTDTLARVFNFLQVAPQPPALQIRDANDKYFRRWKQAGGGVLSRYYIDDMARHFESRVSRFGYSLRAVNTGESPFLGLRAISSIYRAAGVGRHLGFRSYKQLKRSARTLGGRKRKRRSAVDSRPLVAPEAPSANL